MEISPDDTLSPRKVILSKELLMLIQQERTEEEVLAQRSEFISMGRSEVTSVPCGSLGVSEIRVKGYRDFYKADEALNLLYRIDNSGSKATVKQVFVKLIRALRFKTHGDIFKITKQPALRFLLFSGKYDGAESGELQRSFAKRIIIDLAKVFNLKWSEEEGREEGDCGSSCKYSTRYQCNLQPILHPAP